ncbi:MAG: metal-dependent hydrolase [Phycisphaeraceae bacterium]|nr:metal-dependent hydrolase [Phycisphaeraceae bacterium]MCW5754896.1 metal-dependent hydrolase [Phycisphaeraceae bacterium]
MPLTVTFLGHSAVLLDSGDTRLVIDPFLTGNPNAPFGQDKLHVHAVALTHGHSDHFGDTIDIARRCDATVYASWEICEFCGEHGLTRLEPGNAGGRINAPWGWVAFTQAFHSSSYQGRYMGQPMGVVVHLGGVTVYHCGDTGLFTDMKLLGEIYRPALACIPIGDRFTMGPELASRAAELIGAPKALPVHYNTFPPIQQDTAAFKPQGVHVHALKPGASIVLD